MVSLRNRTAHDRRQTADGGKDVHDGQAVNNSGNAKTSTYLGLVGIAMSRSTERQGWNWKRHRK